MAGLKVEKTASAKERLLVAEMEFLRVLMTAAATDGSVAGQLDCDAVAVLVARLGCMKVLYSVVWRGGEMAGMMAASLVEHWAAYSAVAMVGW